VVRGLVDAIDPDRQAKAIAENTAKDPSDVIQDLLDRAIEPLAANPDLRNRILELRRAHDRVIDEVSVDVLLDAHGVVDTERARSVITSFKDYLEQHRVEITAIQLLGEARDRRINFADIKELADRIARPPYNQCHLA
jgi:type I restriction enzyme R subunit